MFTIASVIAVAAPAPLLRSYRRLTATTETLVAVG